MSEEVSSSRSPFPEGFLWGTATSSHQVEGDNQGNDWWDWERDPSHIYDRSSSGRALDWWAGRAEEDFALARSQGQNAIRLSLEWSRLEPEPGRWDERAFARYEAMLRAARALGLSPMVTLNHFTLPRWLSARGAWLARDASERFVRFAGEAVSRLHAHVDLWATLNEPNVLAYTAYANRTWPPGRGDLTAAFRAYGTMLRAHALGYRAVKAAQPEARVGIVLSLPVFDPVEPKRRHRAPAWLSDWAYAGAALHGLASGWLLPPAAATYMPELRESFDWLGVNYYGRYRVEFDPRSLEFFGRRPSAGHIKTPWTDWGEPWPEGLRRRLVELSRFGVPLYVTENGIFDATDERRPSFIREHVSAVADARRVGADVRGYFHWTLIDNFEWAEGYATPFGLFALDRATGRRTPRASAELYARICRSNGADGLGSSLNGEPPRAR